MTNNIQDHKCQLFSSKLMEIYFLKTYTTTNIHLLALNKTPINV